VVRNSSGECGSGARSREQGAGSRVQGAGCSREHKKGVDTFTSKAKTLRRKTNAHSRALDVHRLIVSRPFAMNDSGLTGFDDSEDGAGA